HGGAGEYGHARGAAEPDHRREDMDEHDPVVRGRGDMHHAPLRCSLRSKAAVLSGGGCSRRSKTTTPKDRTATRSVTTLRERFLWVLKNTLGIACAHCASS